MKPEELVVLAVIPVIGLVYFLPLIWVLLSGRSHGGAKFGWLIVTFAFSWLGLGAFLIMTQSAKDRTD